MAVGRISRPVAAAAAGLILAIGIGLVLVIAPFDSDDSGAPSPDPTWRGAGGNAGTEPAGDERAFCDAALGLDRLAFEMGDDRSPEAMERWREQFPGLFLAYAANGPDPIAAEVATIVDATKRAFFGNPGPLESPEYSQAQAAVTAYVSETC
jgi:hypothetical protein